MQIEDVYLKFVRIKNTDRSMKELYLVVDVNGRKWIGKVGIIRSGDTAFFQQFQAENIKIKIGDQAYLSFWDYDTAKEFTNIIIATHKLQTLNTCKFFFPNL